MVLLNYFANQYLESYDIKTPINNDIDKGNDSFYYALEYASGDSLHNPTMNEKCIKETRNELYHLELRALYKSGNEESIKTLGEINKSIKPANDGIIGNSSVYKEKIIFILKRKNIQNGESEFTIEIIIPPTIIECNKNNILVLIQNDNIFRTFKHSSCKKVYPNQRLIDKIQDIINKSKKETTKELIKYQLNNDVYKLSCGFELFDTVLFHNMPKKNNKRKEIKTMKNLNKQFALLKKEPKMTATNNSRSSVKKRYSPSSKNRSQNRIPRSRSKNRNSNNNYATLLSQYRSPKPNRPSKPLPLPTPTPAPPPKPPIVRQRTVMPSRPKSKSGKPGINI